MATMAAILVIRMEQFLSVLNLHVAPMPPIKFQLILEQNNFSNSEPPCHPNVSHQAWAQSDLPFRSTYGLKIFMIMASWKSERNNYSNSESPSPLDASHQVSAEFDLRFGRKCCLKISRWPS